MQGNLDRQLLIQGKAPLVVFGWSDKSDFSHALMDVN
jgi:hypothetical protein